MSGSLFEDIVLLSDVNSRSDSRTTSDTSSDVSNNTTVQVWHDHDIELPRVFHHLHAGIIDNELVVLDLWVFLGNFSGALQEQTVAFFHNVGFVDCSDFLSSRKESELKSILSNSERVCSSDDLNALHDSWVDLMLDTRVLSFGVFSQNDDINTFVSGVSVWKFSCVGHVAEHVQILINLSVFNVNRVRSLRNDTQEDVIILFQSLL
mmetsp:Transcript_74219/g.86110  ORF Transcript_74219/g.86110 Transcript_74219/m.86110 type:complete len:207 (-) Transcript_74219:339-959(-)